MSIGGAGLGGGPSLPVTHRDIETQGINEITKKEVVGMVLDTLAEVIPFTKREYDEVFKYRSEADRPTLHPLLHLRFGMAEGFEVDEGKWQPAYQEFFDSLPDHVKDWMAFEMNKPFAERDPEYVLVDNVITLAAKTFAWLSNVNQAIESNSQAAEKYIKNVALPYIALRSLVSSTEATLEFTKAWLSSVGANYPGFDTISACIKDAGNLLSRLELLKEELESGNSNADVRQRLVETAFEFDKLNKQYQSTGNSQGLGILGTTLKSLSLVSASWALSSGSPSLLLGTAIATTGLNSDNETGFLGPSYKNITDSLLNGLLSAISFGPRAELNELNSLLNELSVLNQEGG